MTRSRVVLLVLTLTACLRGSPDAVVLAPLAAYVGPERAGPSNQPEYVVFADELTANVFRNLKRDNRFRIVTSGTGLACPSSNSEGRQGFLLRASVTQSMGDSAIGTVEIMCSSGTGTISDKTHYLLVRRSGKWKMERPISGGTTMSSMPRFILPR